MEEDIRLLEEYLRAMRDVPVGANVCILWAIENLLKAYKELEKRNKELFETCCRYEETLGHYECEIFDELDDYIKLDKLKELDKIGIKGKRYISESKVKEKIKELQEYNNKIDNEMVICTNIMKMQVLQELLKEENQ